MKRRFQKLGMWKIVFTLFVVPLLLTNCQDNTEEAMINDASFKTVAKQEISNLLSNLNKQSSSQKNGKSYVNYDINDLTYEDITNSDAQLAVIPCETKNKAEYSRILILNIQGENQTVVFNMYPSAKNKKAKQFDGEITIATMEGKILRAFRVQDGKFINFFSSINYSSKNFDANYMSSKDSESAECRQWCGHQASDPYCICNMQELDEVVVSGSTSISYVSISDLYGSDAGDTSNCEVGCDETWNSVQSGAPTNDFSDCPDGYVEDKNGNCVEKPCENDPIKNPQIVSSGISGKRGGTFGCTRISTTTCDGQQNRKKHNGLDLKASLNSNIFAMYDGKVTSLRDSFRAGQYKSGSYGNYVIITSTIGGSTYHIRTNHLNSINVANGQTIKAGDIIGLSGNTGNAAGSDVIPHIDIVIYDSSWTPVDPENFVNTKFDSNYNTITNNCNN